MMTQIDEVELRQLRQLRGNSAMLGQIAGVVEPWCPTGGCTTLQAVQLLHYDWMALKALVERCKIEKELGLEL